MRLHCAASFRNPAVTGLTETESQKELDNGRASIGFGIFA